MKVKDILYLHKDFVANAKRLGASHPEDIIQNLWMKLMAMEAREGSIDRIKYGEDGINRVYISIMIKNSILDELRKAPRFIGMNNNFDIVEEQLEEDYRAADVIEIIESLSDEEKKLMNLYLDLNLTEREISDELSVSQSTVNRRLNRVKKKIKKSYQKMNNIS